MASVVYVKWHDAHAVAPSWFALDDIVDEPAIVESVGWLVPNAIAQNASEFYVPLGSWVYNFGYNDQTGIRMAVNITNDGQLVYADTSDAADLVVGDSIWFAMQDFSSSSYLGRYDISYTLLGDSVDNFVNDPIKRISNGVAYAFKNILNKVAYVFNCIFNYFYWVTHCRPPTSPCA